MKKLTHFLNNPDCDNPWEGTEHGTVEWKNGAGINFCKFFSDEEANIALVDIKDTSDLAGEIEISTGCAHALSIEVDISDEEQVQAMIATAVKHCGSLEILVNNAALGSNISPTPITKLSVKDWDALIAVNVEGNISL